MRVILALALFASFSLASAPARAADPKSGPFQRFTPAGAEAAVGTGLSLLQLPRVLQERLQLTAEQRKSLESVRKGLDQSLRAGQPTGAAAIERYQGAVAAQAHAEADAEAVLDRQQRKRFHLMATDYQQYQPLGRAGLALLLVDGLTDDQKTLLKEQSRAAQSRRQETFRSLAQKNDPAARLQAAVLLNQTSEAAVRKVLTPEQQRQFAAALRALPAS